MQEVPGHFQPVADIRGSNADYEALCQDESGGALHQQFRLREDLSGGKFASARYWRNLVASSFQLKVITRISGRIFARVFF